MKLLNRIFQSLQKALSDIGFPRAEAAMTKYFEQNPTDVDTLDHCAKYVHHMIVDKRHESGNHFRYVCTHHTMETFKTFKEVQHHATQDLHADPRYDLMFFIQEHDKKDHYTLFCLYRTHYERNFTELNDKRRPPRVYIDENPEHATLYIHPQPIAQTFIILKM